jgi:hypothetical protein
VRKNILAVLFLVICPVLVAQQAMNNDAITKLVKAGLSDDLIVSTINAQPGTYDTSTDGIIALKKAGVSDRVVAAIVGKTANPAPAAPSAMAPIPPSAPVASAVPAAVDSVGVYYQAKDGNWLEVEAETVNMRTQGFPAHTDGVLKGQASRLRLAMPANLILDVPEGRSPGEYQLLRFDIKGDRREFRSVTMGWAHVSTGAAKNRLEFESKKIAPHVYQITLGQGLGRGEYGFLPPTDTMSLGNLASNGKAYTFTVE